MKKMINRRVSIVFAAASLLTTALFLIWLSGLRPMPVALLSKFELSQLKSSKLNRINL